MNKRAQELIEILKLEPHPEGGYFRRVFYSPNSVIHQSGGYTRPAITAIYFLLTQRNVSRLHRLRSDEVWHYYEGAPLELHTVTNIHRTYLLGPVSENSKPVAVVPSLSWQAARTLGEYTLVGCTVGPGFEYEDFELLKENQQSLKWFLKKFPELGDFL